MLQLHVPIRMAVGAAKVDLLFAFDTRAVTQSAAGLNMSAPQRLVLLPRQGLSDAPCMEAAETLKSASYDENFLVLGFNFTSAASEAPDVLHLPSPGSRCDLLRPRCALVAAGPTGADSGEAGGRQDQNFNSSLKNDSKLCRLVFTHLLL